MMVEDEDLEVEGIREASCIPISGNIHTLSGEVQVAETVSPPSPPHPPPPSERTRITNQSMSGNLQHSTILHWQGSSRYYGFRLATQYEWRQFSLLLEQDAT
jgi:hypothetical protein